MRRAALAEDPPGRLDRGRQRRVGQIRPPQTSAVIPVAVDQRSGVLDEEPQEIEDQRVTPELAVRAAFEKLNTPFVPRDDYVGEKGSAARLDAASDLAAQKITASFSPGAGTLSIFGGGLGNTIAAGRDGAGAIQVNGGAVPIKGGASTVANTTLIQAFGLGGNDALAIDETNGAMPRANLFGGAGNDTATGGSGGDMLFGQSGNDALLGTGGNDFLFGGSENDTLTGGDGDDQMFGESGDDRMIWNPGDDTDLHEGGAGHDR